MPPKESELYSPLQVHITPHPPKSSTIYAPPTPPTPTYLPSAHDVQSPTPHPFLPSASPFHHPHPSEVPTHVFIPPSAGPSPSPHPNHNHIPSAQEFHDPAYNKKPHNTWFYGPPAHLRAHIQNIDLVPSYNRALSPSEALRLDELREQHAAQHRHQNSYHHRL